MREVLEVGDRIRATVARVELVGRVAEVLRTSEGVPVVVGLVVSERVVRRLAFLTGFAPSWFYGGPLPELGTVFVCGRRSR